MIILLMWYTNNDSCGTQIMIIYSCGTQTMIILLMWYTNNDNITHVVHKQ
jgi:hypothetical protein